VDGPFVANFHGTNRFRKELKKAFVLYWRNGKYAPCPGKSDGISSAAAEGDGGHLSGAESVFPLLLCVQPSLLIATALRGANAGNGLNGYIFPALSVGAKHLHANFLQVEFAQLAMENSPLLIVQFIKKLQNVQLIVPFEGLPNFFPVIFSVVAHSCPQKYRLPHLFRRIQVFRAKHAGENLFVEKNRKYMHDFPVLPCGGHRIDFLRRPSAG
jgi:hypothetical protein